MLETELMRKKEALKALHTHYVDARKQASETLSQLEELSERLRLSKEEIKRLKNEKAVAKKEHSDITKALDKVREQTVEEQWRLADLQERLRRLQSEEGASLARAELAGHKVIHEQGKLRATEKMAVEHLHGFQVETIRIQTELKNVQKSLSDASNEYAVMEAKLEDIMTTYARKSSTYNSEYLDWKHKRQQLVDECKELQSQSTTLKSTCDDTREELERIKDDKERLLATTSADTAAMDKRSKLLNQKLEESVAMLKDVTQAVKLLEDQKRDLETNLADLRRMCADAEREAEGSRVSAQKELAIFKAEIIAARHTANLERDAVREQRSELDQTHSELQRLRQQLEEASSKLQDQEERLPELLLAVDELESRREMVMQQLAAGEKEAKILYNSLNDRRTQLEINEAALSESKQFIQKCKHEEETLRVAEARLRESLQSLQQQIASSQADLKRARAEAETEANRLTQLMERRACAEAERSRVEDLTLTLHDELRELESRRNGMLSQEMKLKEDARQASQEAAASRRVLESLKRREAEVEARERGALKMLESMGAAADKAVLFGSSEEMSELAALKAEKEATRLMVESTRSELKILQAAVTSANASLQNVRRQWSEAEERRRYAVSQQTDIESNIIQKQTELHALDHSLRDSERRLRQLHEEVEEAQIRRNLALKYVTLEGSQIQEQLRNAKESMSQDLQAVRCAQEQLSLTRWEVDRLAAVKRDTQAQIFLLSESAMKLRTAAGSEGHRIIEHATRSEQNGTVGSTGQSIGLAEEQPKFANSLLAKVYILKKHSQEILTDK